MTQEEEGGLPYVIQQKFKMARNKQELIDAIEHISFEMNRYLYAAHPIFPLPGRYFEVVSELLLSGERYTSI